jgi:transcription factor TFIIIB component B''
VKSAGYDPDRPWDKEEALFAEAKKDMARIQAEDRGAIFDENGEMVGEADEGSQMGDEEAVPDGEGGEAGGEEGEENEGGNESLFLPGATSP